MMIEKLVIGIVMTIQMIGIAMTVQMIDIVMMVQMTGMMVQQSILNHTMQMKVDNWILRFGNTFVQQVQIGKMQRQTGSQIAQLENIVESLEQKIGKTQNQMGNQTVHLERMLVMLEPIGMNQRQIDNQTGRFANMMEQLEKIGKIQHQAGNQTVQILSIVNLLEQTDKKRHQTGSQTVHQILRQIGNQRMNQFCMQVLRLIVDTIQKQIDIQQLHYLDIQSEIQMSMLKLQGIFGNCQNFLGKMKKEKMVQSEIHNQNMLQIRSLVDEPPQERQMQ